MTYFNHFRALKVLQPIFSIFLKTKELFLKVKLFWNGLMVSVSHSHMLGFLFAPWPGQNKVHYENGT